MKMTAEPDASHDGNRQRMTDYIIYNEVSQVSVVMPAFLPVTIALHAALFCQGFLRQRLLTGPLTQM